MRDVAVVSFAQSRHQRRERSRSEVEMLLPVIAEAIEQSGIPKREIGFTCSGSSDYIAGHAFSFVGAVDALGAWPPICESHVEMDGAWALYEAWVKLQCGTADSALVFRVLCWVDEPVLRGRCLDAINTAIYKALREAGISIPFPQRDVHLYPAAGGAAGISEEST